MCVCFLCFVFLFFFNDTATTEIYTLSLHDALPISAMEGWPDAVRVLLAHGASVHVRDREFKGQPLIWAAEGSRQGREGRDFAAVGKLLLAAGSPVEWETTAEPAEGLLEIVDAWRRG